MPNTAPPQPRAVCATCGRDFAVRKSPNVRSHSRPHTNQPWRDVGCEGSGQPPARTFPADAPIRAAALRQAAERLLAHPGPHTDALQPDAPGFWWDTRDRDAATVLLLQWAGEIHPA
jgi:hypothetical protein